MLKPRAGTCETEAATFIKLGRRPGLAQCLSIPVCATAEGHLMLTELASRGSLDTLLEVEGEAITLAHNICCIPPFS